MQASVKYIFYKIIYTGFSPLSDHAMHIACTSTNQQVIAACSIASKLIEEFARKQLQKFLLFHTAVHVNIDDVIRTGIKKQSSVVAIITPSLEETGK